MISLDLFPEEREFLIFLIIRLKRKSVLFLNRTCINEQKENKIIVHADSVTRL